MPASRQLSSSGSIEPYTRRFSGEKTRHRERYVRARLGHGRAGAHRRQRIAVAQLRPDGTIARGTAAKPAPPGGIAAAAASANRLVNSKPEVLKAGRHDAFKAGKVLSSMGLNYVPYERTYRGIPVVGGDFVVSDGQQRQDPRDQRRADPPGQAPLGQGHRLQGRGPRHQRAPAEPRHPRQEPPRGPADEALPARLGDLGDRAQARRGLAPDGVRRRPHRSRSSTTKEHVLEGTGNGNWEGSVTIPTTGSGSSFSMTEQQRLHAQVPERERQRRPSPAPTTCGATAARPTARPAASTRSTRPRRCAR